MSWWTGFIGPAYSQPIPDPNKVVCLDPKDAGAALKCLEESPLKDDQISVQQQQISVLEQESQNCDSTSVECMKLKDLAEKESAIYKDAYEREKLLADKTMKLADEGNKTKWGQLLGAGALGLIIGLLFILAL